MEVEYTPETAVALFATLADAEATLQALQDASVPYPDIRLSAHTPADLEQAGVDERSALAGISAPEHYWALAVLLDPKWRDKALEVLQSRQPFAIGRLAAANAGRSDTDRGAIAWRHYVFETHAATDPVGEAAGTAGTTGVISSGVFATGAQAVGNPPANSVPASDQRPSTADEQPTTDERRPVTSTDRSRPETELKP